MRERFLFFFIFSREHACIINTPIEDEDISFVFSMFFLDKFFTIIPYFEIYILKHDVEINTIFQIPDSDGSRRSN